MKTSASLLFPTLLSATTAGILIACSGHLDVGSTAIQTDGGPASANPTTGTGTSSLVTANDVALGTGHGCAILKDQTVACWGFNAYGQTGVSQADSIPGDDGQHYVNVPHVVPGLSNVTQITADWQISCALTGGQVYCWGARQGGNAATVVPDGGVDGGVTGTEVPTLVQGLDNVVEIRSGGGPACARKSDGSVWCWGDNTYRSVGPSATPHGNGSPMGEFLPPTRVAGISDAVSIAVSDETSCAVHAGGDVSCWGRVGITQEIVDDDDVPQLIPKVHHVKQLVLAQGAALALLDDGSVMGFGGGGRENGILSLIAVPTDPHITDIDHEAVAPAVFPGLSNIKEVAAQYHTMCVLDADDVVLCWGDNYGGELGTGHTTDLPTIKPAPVAGIAPAAAVFVGTWNTCAKKPNGDLICWGTGGEGALGNGDPAPPYAATPGKPVLLPAPLAQ